VKSPEGRGNKVAGNNVPKPLVIVVEAVQHHLLERDRVELG
jgi:hypothetical protein